MAKVKVNNIVRFSHGGTDYKGITEGSMDTDEGDFVPDIDEGALYATAIDLVGTPGRFPSNPQFTLENIADFVSLLTASVGDAVLLGKAHGSNDNEQFTVANVLFRQGTLSLSRQQDANIQVQGIAYSADGSAHPFSRSSVVDSTGPTGTKIKINNLVSVAHSAVPTPGVLGVQLSVNRGQYTPDMDEGDLYPIGADLLGVGDGYPVEVTLNMENMQAASIVGTSVDDLVITGKAAAGQSNQVITANNVRFRTGQSQLRRQQDGTVNLTGIAYASSADALPLGIASA